MLKITAILSLIFIVSTVWCACDSCGSECERACGTRRFRACCFNYLRRKRAEGFKMTHLLGQDVKASERKSAVPEFQVDNMAIPELWTTGVSLYENHPYALEDMFENRSE